MHFDEETNSDTPFFSFGNSESILLQKSIEANNSGWTSKGLRFPCQLKKLFLKNLTRWKSLLIHSWRWHIKWSHCAIRSVFLVKNLVNIWNKNREQKSQWKCSLSKDTRGSAMYKKLYFEMNKEKSKIKAQFLRRRVRSLHQKNLLLSLRISLLSQKKFETKT